LHIDITPAVTHLSWAAPNGMKASDCFSTFVAGDDFSLVPKIINPIVSL
jgi:hypothetical protein